MAQYVRGNYHGQRFIAGSQELLESLLVLVLGASFEGVEHKQVAFELLLGSDPLGFLILGSVKSLRVVIGDLPKKVNLLVG